MFKLFQHIRGGSSKNSTEINENSLDSLSPKTSRYLSSRDGKDSTMDRAELVWQQGNLQEAINLYDRAIQENPDSSEPYQQLLTHLKQQNSVAEAYKKLAASLKAQGNNEEAATCYRQAIVIQAVTKEAAAKYQKSSLVSRLANVPKIADLKNNAFSFQGTIKEIISKTKPNLLQIELPPEYNPHLSSVSKTKQLDSRKIATVEWEAAQTFMQKALDCCDREEWSEVADACEQATLVMPEMAEAYKIWGNALQRMNRTAEAMECYGKAVEIQPDLAEVYAGIAQLYAQQQKWQSAREYYQKAIIIKPEFPRAYRSLAYVWEQSGQVENAKICHHRAKELESKQPALSNAVETNSARSTQKALKNSPEIVDDSVFTYQKLGQDSEQQNLWHEAAVYYRKALELNLVQTQELADSKIVLTNEQQDRTNQLANLTKIPPAISSEKAELTEREILAPIEDSITSHTKRLKTNISQSENSLDRAIGRYYRQAKLQPNSAAIQIDLGDLYAKKRKWQSAIACYSKAIRIDPRTAEAHIKLAKILAKTGNHPHYVEHMYLAYTLKPDMGSADDHFLLGQALRKLGNRTRAISCYEQAIKLQPRFNEAYRCLGKVYQEIGKPKNAIAAYQVAVRHNPQDADFHFSLGELQEQQGSWENAVRAYRKVLELNPKYPQASQRLNYALSEKLKQDLAIRSKRLGRC